MPAERIISLDISSSTIGWALIEADVEKPTHKLIEYGYIRPPSKAKAEKIGQSFSYRLNSIFDSVEQLFKEHNPDVIAVEHYVLGFSKGRSQIKTISILSSVNEAVCLAAFRHNKKEPERIPVQTIRARMSKKFGYKVKDKEDVLKAVKKEFSNFVPEISTRTMKIKAQSYDVSDAIAVGLTYIILKRNK